MRSTCEDLSNKKKKKGTWKNSLKLTSEKSEVLRFVLPAAHKKRKEKKQLRLSFHHQMQQSTKLFWTCFIVWSFYNYPLTFSHESHLDWAENQSNEGKTWKWAKPAANYVIATISHFFEEKSWAKAEKPKTWKQNTFVRSEEWGAGEKTKQILMRAVQLLVAHWKSKISNNTEFDVCEYKYKRVQMELGNWMTGRMGVSYFTVFSLWGDGTVEGQMRECCRCRSCCCCRIAKRIRKKDGLVLWAIT